MLHARAPETTPRARETHATAWENHTTGTETTPWPRKITPRAGDHATATENHTTGTGDHARPRENHTTDTETMLWRRRHHGGTEIMPQTWKSPRARGPTPRPRKSHHGHRDHAIDGAPRAQRPCHGHGNYTTDMETTPRPRKITPRAWRPPWETETSWPRGSCLNLKITPPRHGDHAMEMETHLPVGMGPCHGHGKSHHRHGDHATETETPLPLETTPQTTGNHTTGMGDYATDRGDHTTGMGDRTH